MSNDDPSIDSSIGRFLESPELKRGDRVEGDYEIRRFLSEGSFGRVYEAWDLRLDRRVALKVIESRAGVPDLALRFKREVSMTKRIQHSNVVHLYSFGEEEGAFYMVMEFLEGARLADVIAQESPFPRPRAMNIVLQIVDALVEAQKHNVVHRDLKPENVMLVEEGVRRDVVKLLDFGLAKAYGSSGLSHLGMISSSLALGTPLYMAPEQIQGEAIGFHTDIYAVGLMLIEMITGRPAFPGEAALEILARKQSIDITVSTESLGEELAKVVQRCVDRDPTRRYPSARDLFVALTRVARWNPITGVQDISSISRAGSVTPPPPSPSWQRDVVDQFFDVAPTTQTHAVPDEHDPRGQTLGMERSALSSIRSEMDELSADIPALDIEPDAFAEPPKSSVLRRPSRRPRPKPKPKTGSGLLQVRRWIDEDEGDAS